MCSIKELRKVNKASYSHQIQNTSEKEIPIIQKFSFEKIPPLPPSFNKASIKNMRKVNIKCSAAEAWHQLSHKQILTNISDIGLGHYLHLSVLGSGALFPARDPCRHHHDHQEDHPPLHHALLLLLLPAPPLLWLHTITPPPSPWDASDHTKLFHGQMWGGWQICHFWGQLCHIYRRCLPAAEMQNGRGELSEHLLRGESEKWEWLHTWFYIKCYVIDTNMF